MSSLDRSRSKCCASSPSALSRSVISTSVTTSSVVVFEVLDSSQDVLSPEVDPADVAIRLLFDDFSDPRILQQPVACSVGRAHAVTCSLCCLCAVEVDGELVREAPGLVGELSGGGAGGWVWCFWPCWSCWRSEQSTKPGGLLWDPPGFPFLPPLMFPLVPVAFGACFMRSPSPASASVLIAKPWSSTFPQPEVTSPATPDGREATRPSSCSGGIQRGRESIRRAGAPVKQPRQICRSYRRLDGRVYRIRSSSLAGARPSTPPRRSRPRWMPRGKNSSTSWRVALARTSPKTLARTSGIPRHNTLRPLISSWAALISIPLRQPRQTR